MPAPPDQGYTSITTARQTLGPYSFANIGHIATSRTAHDANSSRVEFRLWDGSLEPGRIQAQIKMSTAMLDYTARNRNLTFDADERTPAGTLNPRPGGVRRAHQANPGTDRRTVPPRRRQATGRGALGGRTRRPEITREYLR
jgi:hypothetical protein